MRKSSLQKIYEKFRKKQLIEIPLQEYKPKIAFFTGAGISRESGLSTFRDSGGLWEKHRIEDVATASAIRKNFELVNNFYNQRRAEVRNTLPNKAHLIIKELEEIFDVFVVTQNVDDLHEKAGTANIIHLHGEIMKSRSMANTNLIYDQQEDIKVGDKCIITNSQLRPHIILFNERLNEEDYYKARRHIREADILVVIGTSLEVEPAASLVTEALGEKEFYIIDPDDVELKYKSNYIHIQKTATEGLSELKSLLIEQAKLLKNKFEEEKNKISY